MSLRRLLAQRIDLWALNRLQERSEAFRAERGPRFAILAHDFIGHHINQFGVYERSDLELLFGFLSPVLSDFRHSACLDVGANIGNHAVYFSKFFERVVAFEPHPAIYPLLAFNTNNLANVEAAEIALGDSTAALTLTEDAANMGSSSLRYIDAIDARQYSVQVRPMDSFAVGPQPLGLIKIDVEGFETQVIKGGLSTITREQPVIVFEHRLCEFRNGSSEAIDMLSELGYRFCWPEVPQRKLQRFSRGVQLLTDSVTRGSHEYSLVGGDSSVPVADYQMLIAVPRCLQHALGMRSPATANQDRRVPRLV